MQEEAALRPDPGAQLAIWRFGAVELDEVQASLRVHGRKVALDRGAYRVLLRLLHSAGEVVGKDELLRAGWPERRVSDNSLPQAIGRLRQALDDPDGAWLRVEHGYGYKLVGAVQRERPPTAGAEPLGAVEPPRSRHLRAVLLVAALGLIVLLIWQRGLLFGGQSAHAVAEPPAAAASIAVLPLVDLSPNQDLGHFSDGLADQLLSSLSRLTTVRVAARTSSFSYRDRRVDIPTIGRELQVDTVLEGSVRESNGRLRVTLQLIDSADGFHRWAQTYDRPITELFQMQDEITRAVIAALRIELLPEAGRELARRGTDNPAAYEQLLRGMYLFKDDETGNRRTLAAYRRAVELDPDFDEAWLSLAAHLGHTGLYADSADEALAGKHEAIEILDRVLARAPQRADAWLLRGDLRYAHWWQWEAAEQDLEQARQLEGVDELSYLLRLARLRAATGRLPEALELTGRITEIAPLSDAWAVRGYHLIGAKRYDEAERALAQAVRNFPLDEHAHYYLGLIDLLQQRPREALAHFEDSAHVFRLTGAAVAHHALGDAAASERELQLLISRYGHILPYQAAEVYAWRGEPDLAFEWFERAHELHDASFMYLSFDPLLDPVRADPRFDALLQRVHLKQ